MKKTTPDPSTQQPASSLRLARKPIRELKLREILQVSGGDGGWAYYTKEN